MAAEKQREKALVFQAVDYIVESDFLEKPLSTLEKEADKVGIDEFPLDGEEDEFRSDDENIDDVDEDGEESSDEEDAGDSSDDGSSDEDGHTEDDDDDSDENAPLEDGSGVASFEKSKDIVLAVSNDESSENPNEVAVEAIDSNDFPQEHQASTTPTTKYNIVALDNVSETRPTESIQNESCT